jgi:hypothetical protein
MINEQTLFISLAAGLLVAYLIFPVPDIILKYDKENDKAGKCRASNEEVDCGDL